MKLLLGTKNRGKVREISKVLKDLPLEVVGLRDFKDIIEPAETGKSFAANARIKAKAYNQQTGLLTLAEDSGLIVDCLGGVPGVLSARYAGDGASDIENTRRLLREMRNVKSAKRTARFVCVIAITDGITLRIASGKCEGKIALRPIGSSGFGYDPVFIPEAYRTTFAKLGTGVKNEISHRGRALQKVPRLLNKFMLESLKQV